MTVNIRCGLTRIPFEDGDEVLVIPVSSLNGDWAVSGAPCVGTIDEFGVVTDTSGRRHDFTASLFVSSEAAESLRTTAFASRISSAMQRVDRKIQEISESLSASKTSGERDLIVAAALSHLSIPVKLPHPEAVDADEDHGNMDFIRNVQKDAGFLRFAEYLDLTLRPSEANVTIMSKSEHKAMLGGMSAAMGKNRRIASELEDMKGMF